MNNLKEFIPDGYFSEGKEKLTYNSSLPAAKHWSAELHWGHHAAKLGKELFFDYSITMTPRQKSASELLMNLGLLAGAEASQKAAEYLSEHALSAGVDDANSGEVSNKLKNEQLPTLSENVKGSLSLYLNQLPEREADAFRPLLGKSSESFYQKCKVAVVKGLSWIIDNVVVKIVVGVIVSIVVAIIVL